MSEQRALYKATKELTKAIESRSRDAALSPEFFESYAKELGGAKGLGARLAQDFKRVHGEDLAEEEKAFFTHDEKTIQRYWQMLMTFMQQQDRQNAVDISSLSDEDLQATLSLLAKNLIEQDEEFRRSVVKVCANLDRKLIEELATEAGLIGPSVDADPPAIEEQPEEPPEGDEAIYPEEH